MGGRSSRFGIEGTLAVVFSLGLIASVVLTILASFGRSTRSGEYELARLGLEDVAHRVELGVKNLKSARAMSDAVALSRARSLAQLIAENPRVLEPGSRGRFNSFATLLGVDELHVTDEKAVLVRSFPSVYEGKSLADSAQSAAFLPALTNASFALVQEPQGKGLATGDDGRDALIFQYAGVPRRDRPGIVQVGYRAERVAEAMRLADIGVIAETTRIGRHGRVSIVRADGLQAADPSGRRLGVDDAGRRVTVFEMDCEGYRIMVTLPYSASWLANERTFPFLIVLDLILLMFFVFSFSAARGRIVRETRNLYHQLNVRGLRRQSFFRLFFSPLSLIAFVFFVAVLVAIYGETSRVAMRTARERLRASAEDIVDDLDDCVGKQLAFVGRTICDIYGTPEGMKGADLGSLMKAHGLDELNVIDGRGFIVGSTVPGIVGHDQWKKANPAKFNQALLKDGHAVFAQAFRESADEPGTYFKYVGVAFAPPASGYVQLGFTRARLQDTIDYSLEGMASHWHIGESGFFIISKMKNGEILSAGLDELKGKTLAEVGFDVFTAREMQNVELRDSVSQEFLGFKEVRFFESEIAGQRCLCTSGISNRFHRYVAALPLEEVYGPARNSVLVTGVALFVTLVVVVLFLTKLTNLVASLREKERLEHERQLKDLTLAKTIQSSSLPVSFPDEADYKIFATMDTAREVGGDFYDFYSVSAERVLFLVADVSGKGIPAALFMMKAKALLRAAVAARPHDLAAAVAAANEELADHNDAEMFVTAWIGLYDRRTGDVDFVNAGHNPPLVKRADGSVEWVRERSGLVLAAMAGAPYRVRHLVLRPGDSLFLYTDGVTEAMDAAGELYGEARLERTLTAAGEHFVMDVRRDLTAFAAGAEQSDDITMLAFDVRKNRTQPTENR